MSQREGPGFLAPVEEEPHWVDHLDQPLYVQCDALTFAGFVRYLSISNDGTVATIQLRKLPRGALAPDEVTEEINFTLEQAWNGPPEDECPT